MDRNRFLPIGKKYHIFFFNEHFQRDKEWSSNVVKRLESYGYNSGSITDDFDSGLSIFENIEQKVEHSMAIAFVISEKSLKSRAFIHHVENAVLFVIDSEDYKKMLPILLDENIKRPNCLRNYEPLLIIEDNDRWWQHLVKVLEMNSSLSSSGESDEEVKGLVQQIMTTMTKKSFKKQKKFRNMCKESGIAQLTSQMGTCSVHTGLMKGCGVEIVEKTMILKWDRFENVMIENRDTLANIVNFNKNCVLREVTFNFTKEGQARLIERIVEWKDELVKFIENSLNYDFYGGNFDKMTYNVIIEGHSDYSFLHLMNNVARNIYIDNYKYRSSQFDTVEKRIETFRNWPYKKNGIQPLVEAGFIYTGELDTVVCFSCNQSLFGIGHDTNETKEELLIQHLLWSGDCTFLNQHEGRSVQSLIRMKSSIEKLAWNPYNPFVYMSQLPRTLYERTKINHRLLRKIHLPFNALMLAKIGFIILSVKNMSFDVICVDCNFMTNGASKSITDLEFQHMMLSGEDCPFLLKRKGIEAIQQFKRDNDLRVQYRTSISLKSIMINRNQ